MLALIRVLEALQVITFGLGLISLLLSFRFFLFFRKSSHHLSRTMRFFLAEQVITSGGTLAFSFNSMWATVTGQDASTWNNISPTIAIGIRVLMFAAMIQSTASLSFSVMKVLHDD